MMEVPPASRALQMLGVQHEVFRHPGVVTSIEQAARERDQRPGQVVRSILFRVEAGRYVLVLTAGGGPISWRKLRKHLAQTRLTLASPSEVLEVTAYPIGAVSPFGLCQPLQMLVDRRVLLEAQSSVGCGVANMGVILRSTYLLRSLPSAQVADLL